LQATLGEVMHKITQKEVHRLVIVDSRNVLVGIVSLSDILRFLLV
jgi:predicted transcriptional regulator